MAGIEPRVECQAPAKLNLFLHVIGRRPDGFHLLQTLFRFLEYGDMLAFTRREDGGLRRVTQLAGVDVEHDLTMRAARLLQAVSGTRFGADIELDKRLPMGGGLGGGSSDAACALLALNRLWELRWSRSRLQELALSLGADVPVFVFGRSAFAEGVGERLQAVELAAAWYVVLAPPVAVSTAEVFAAPELTRNSDPITIRRFSAGPVRNDLEAVVSKRYPEVAQHLAWLRQFGPAGMTGSGACVFGAFDSERSATEVFRGRPPAMQGFVARGLDRHPLWDWVT